MAPCSSCFLCLSCLRHSRSMKWKKRSLCARRRTQKILRTPQLRWADFQQVPSAVQLFCMCETQPLECVSRLCCRSCLGCLGCLRCLGLGSCSLGPWRVDTVGLAANWSSANGPESSNMRSSGDYCERSLPSSRSTYMAFLPRSWLFAEPQPRCSKLLNMRFHALPLHS